MKKKIGKIYHFLKIYHRNLSILFNLIFYALQVFGIFTTKKNDKITIVFETNIISRTVPNIRFFTLNIYSSIILIITPFIQPSFVPFLRSYIVNGKYNMILRLLQFFIFNPNNHLCIFTNSYVINIYILKRTIL